MLAKQYIYLISYIKEFSDKTYSFNHCTIRTSQKPQGGADLIESILEVDKSEEYAEKFIVLNVVLLDTRWVWR